MRSKVPRMAVLFLFAIVLLTFTLVGCNSFAVKQSENIEKQNIGSWVAVGGLLNASPTNTNPAIAITTTNQPVVAYNQKETTTTSGSTFITRYNVYVKQWQNNQWVQLGASATGFGSQSQGRCGNISLKLATDNKPVVSCTLDYPNSYDDERVYVRRWSGTQWVSYGSVPLFGETEITSSQSLALDSQNRPIVAFTSYAVVDRRDQPIVGIARWNGSQWIKLGSGRSVQYTDSEGYRRVEGKNPSVAIDSQGTIYLAWEALGNIIVEKWNGSAWIQVGGTIISPDDSYQRKNYYAPQIRIDSAGRPVVLHYNVATLISSGESTYPSLISHEWTGSGWRRNNGSTSCSFGARKTTLSSYSFQLDSSNRRVFAYESGFDNVNKIDVIRHDPLICTNSDFLGTQNLSSNTASFPSLVINSSNIPYVAYVDGCNSSGICSSTTMNVYVKRFVP